MAKKKQTADDMSRGAMLILMEIVKNDSARDADRLAAAKLILECTQSADAVREDGMLKIVFESIPEEYCR